MKRILAIGVMLIVAAGFYLYLQRVGERAGTQVGGAPKRALDNVRSAAARIEQQEAQRAADIERKTDD